MAATALTLTSALANATEVYGKRTTRCLNRDFQVVTDLQNQASFDDLMERVATLPLKEGEAKKDRLIVILRLIYEKPKEAPKQEDAAKAQVSKAKQALEKKKEKVKLALALLQEPEKTGTAPTEADRQAKLSFLLIAHDIIYMEYKWSTAGFKLFQLTRKVEEVDCPLFIIRKDFLQLKTDQIKNPAYSAFLFQWAKLFDPATYTLRPKHLSYADYEQLNKLRSHPDPEIAKICNVICMCKEMELENEKMTISDSIDKATKGYKSLIKDPVLLEFFKGACPKFVELLNMSKVFRSYDHLVPFFHQRVKRCIEAEEEFYLAYRYFYNQLHQVQKGSYSKKKLEFLSQYNRRLHPSYIPGKDVIQTFLSPEQLYNEMSLASITPIEKAAPEAKEDKKKQVRKVEGKDSSTVKDKPLEEHKKDAVEEPSPTPPASKVSYAEAAAKRPPSPEKSVIKSIVEKREISFDKSSYDERVLAWFSKRKEAALGFTPDDAVWKHAFTTIVDQFVGTPYSFKDVWKNENTGKDDTCFCIMADITFVHTKETVSGVFQFTFDENGICYHRWFGNMSNIERLDKLIAKKREKIEFPPLMKPTKPAFEELDQTKFAIDPYFGSITFEDRENGLIIKIYKVRD